MKGLPTYKLIRTKRKTLAITIKNGEVIVKAPQRATLEHINAFIADKSAWIERKKAEFDKKDKKFASVINGDAVMLDGEMRPIVVTDECKRIRYAGDALKLPQKYADEDAKRRAIASWYKRTAAEVLSHKLEQYSIATGLKYASFTTTNARTKWGSCDGKGNIRLNWRLVMLDEALVAYVIIHELAHTVHHDHSAAFWAEVGKFYPDYKAALKRLKEHSVLTSIYR